MTKDRASAYSAAGVNIHAGNALVERLKALAGSTRTRGVVADVGGFGGLFRPDLDGMEEPLLASSTDGVGTKLKLAFAFNRHDTVGIDLVAMNVNDILALGAAPLFFLDYFACGKLDIDTCADVVSGVTEGCRRAGCALLGGETAEMPGMYAPGEYDLAGFCVGIVDNARLVDGSGIQAGDAVIGIASSGIHSNGFSLVRKILAQTGLAGNEPFPGGDGRSVAETLLTPTTIYVEAVRPLLRDMRIKGMAHITGGGFYDNIPRILPTQASVSIQFGSWTIPPVFHWLKENGHLSWPEMLQIFNCGIGFILILPEEQTEEAINRIKAFDLDAWRIGQVDVRAKATDGEWEEQILVCDRNGASI